MVVHGVELSIGSAHGWNAAYLEMLDIFRRSGPLFGIASISDFKLFRARTARPKIGVPLPLPADKGSG